MVSKIVLLFGTKNGNLNELKISDYDCKLNKLKINGFWVHLPDKFAIQMRDYVKFREQILGSEKEKRLFIDIRMNKRKFDNTNEQDSILMTFEKSKILDSALRNNKISENSNVCIKM